MYFDKIKLEKLLQGALNRYNIPGLATCVTHEGKIIYKSGFGLRNVSSSSCVNSKTIFGVASITKLVTALIIKQAENENILKTSDLVSAYVPDLCCVQNTKIEFRHLLNHSAGFPGLPTRHKSTDLFSSKINDGMKSFDDLVRYLNKLDFNMLAEPGKLLSYSNEGYCLLGCIIERLYNDSFISVATEKVFASKRIPFRTFEILKKSEKELGFLFTFFVLETILLSKIFKVDAFNQPAVEQVKNETKKILLNT